MVNSDSFGHAANALSATNIYGDLKMAETLVIEAVKEGDHGAVEKLLDSGRDIHEQDEHGWTPLNWASGQGNVNMVKLLLDNGADMFKTGRDQRTPYMIALAAGRVEVVKYLRAEEDKLELEESPNRRERPYCKAYYLRDLRKFPNWSESRINWKEKKDEDKDDDDRRKETEGFVDDDIAFIHQDHMVTESMWHNENVLFNAITAEWEAFCKDDLGFKVPDDMDLMVPDYVMEQAIKEQEAADAATVETESS